MEGIESYIVQESNKVWLITSYNTRSIRTQYKYKILIKGKVTILKASYHFKGKLPFIMYFGFILGHKGNIVEIQIFYSLYLITIRGQYKDLECMQRYYK